MGVLGAEDRPTQRTLLEGGEATGALGFESRSLAIREVWASSIEQLWMLSLFGSSMVVVD